MFLCQICGNKRCPHGTDHRNACTGSNEPGQRGSRYRRFGRFMETESDGCLDRCSYPNHKCAEHAVQVGGNTLTFERFHHPDGTLCPSDCEKREAKNG